MMNYRQCQINELDSSEQRVYLLSRKGAYQSHGAAECALLMPFSIFYQRLSEHFININSDCTLGKVARNRLAVEGVRFALDHLRRSGLSAAGWGPRIRGAC